MIYVLLTDGFEEVEAITPIDVLRRCGENLTTVGVYKKSVMGAHNIEVKADKVFEEVDFSDMKMLILPGGAGHEGLKTEKVYNLINMAVEKNVTIGAICAAPSIIGEIGLLEGRKATCFPGFENLLKGAKVSCEKVECDGNFITAKGAGAAAEFAFALAEVVCGKEKVENVRKTMQY